MRLNLTTQLYGICEGNKKSNIRKVWLVDGFSRLWLQSSYVQMEYYGERYYLVVDPTKSRQGIEQTRTFDSTNEGADC